MTDCDKCNDKGEYETRVNGIINAKTNEPFIIFSKFCSCKLGQQMAKDFNNGMVKK